MTWRIKLHAEYMGSEVRLLILRPSPHMPNHYLCVADDVRPGPLPAGLSLFSIVIPVQQGDFVGFYASDEITCQHGNVSGFDQWRRQGSHSDGEVEEYTYVHYQFPDLINADLQTSDPPSTPTPTPPPNTIGCGSGLQDYNLEAGDEFLLTMTGWNTTAEEAQVLQYVVLELDAEFFFGSHPDREWDPSWPWPDWTDEPDPPLRILHSGQTFADTILDFDWPEGAGVGGGTFYFGLIDSITNSVLGEISWLDFTYQ